MSKKRSIVALAIGAAINTVSVVAPTMANKIAWRLFCYPPPWRPKDPEEAAFKRAGEAVLTEAEQGNVVLASGERIATYLWRALHSPTQARVVLVHGWTGAAASMAAFVEPLREAGFDVVAMDMPGHGQSSGHTHRIDLGARVMIALDKAMGPFDAAITHSHGGASFGASLGGLPTVTGRIRVSHAVMIAPPNQVGKLVDDFATLFGFRSSIRTHLVSRTEELAGMALADVLIGRFVAASECRLLVVHDRCDDIVPFEEGETIAGLARGDLHVTEGLGHRKVIADRHVIERVVAFVKSDR
ncbi:MAG TPA: alpha/beta fold hydrolase [Hyphomicrobiaceae bacterium]|nr:alpha/beta fold hydrolase [Hyphomicrobiaceae bacterium]